MLSITIYVLFILFYHFSFPIAIKKPNTKHITENNALLDEAKTMLEVGSYHESIVNLQGIDYETDNNGKTLSEV